MGERAALGAFSFYHHKSLSKTYIILIILIRIL